MINLNRAMVLGNATRDAELRSTPNGRSVAGFAIATNRRWTDQSSGEQREEVQFHEIVAWGKLAEITGQIIKKGARVYAEGRLQTRTWEGQDGARREKTEIIAENVIALSGRGETEAPATREKKEKDSPTEKKSDKAKEAGSDKSEKKQDEDEINLDDIPF